MSLKYNKCLFLDRDGVINYDYGHVYKKCDFKFIPGIFELVKLANSFKLKVVVVTNQAGIGKGLYSIRQFNQLNDWMISQFEIKMCKIDKVYFCPYHIDSKIIKYKKESLERKPNPGMLIKAAADLNINLKESIIIGDKITDIIAGERVGLKYKLLINNDIKKEKNFHKIEHLNEAEYFLRKIV